VIISKARSYGLAAVDEQVKMMVVAQNIKSCYLDWRREKRAAKVMEMTRPDPILFIAMFSTAVSYDSKGFS